MSAPIFIVEPVRFNQQRILVSGCSFLDVPEWDKQYWEPKKYPVIKNYKGSGMGASHQMSWGETDTKQGRKYHVFPNIVQDKTGQLKDLGKQSYKYALDNKEAIQFNTAKEADWFSRKYKSVWKKK